MWIIYLTDSPTIFGNFSVLFIQQCVNFCLDDRVRVLLTEWIMYWTETKIKTYHQKLLDETEGGQVGFQATTGYKNHKNSESLKALFQCAYWGANSHTSKTTGGWKSIPKADHKNTVKYINKLSWPCIYHKTNIDVEMGGSWCLPVARAVPNYLTWAFPWPEESTLLCCALPRVWSKLGKDDKRWVVLCITYIVNLLKNCSWYLAHSDV